MEGNSSHGLFSLFESQFLFLSRSSSSEVGGSNNCFLHEGDNLFLLVSPVSKVRLKFLQPEIHI